MTPFTPQEKEKFERIKELCLTVVKKMDNKKMLNYKRYESLFQLFEQNPDEFRKWAVLTDDSLDSTVQLLQLPFEEVRMTQIKDAADFLNIPLEEYIYYRHNDPRGIRTRTKVPVGYVAIKRVQQILSKKNHYSFDIDDRSLKTGDVKGDAKVASLSDVESFALSAIGADRALEEFLGPRADAQSKKRAMYRQIARDGYCSLGDLEEDRSSSTTLNTINTYLIAAGLRSDLVNNSLKTEFTIDKDLKK